MPSLYRDLALIALIACSAATAHAAPFTARFDGLRIGLQARQDTTTGKQQRAVAAALKALDKPSPTLATDLRLAAKLITKLAKAFPDDFSGQTGVASFLSDTLRELRDDAGVELSSAVGKTSALADSACATRARRTSTKAQGLFDAATLGPPPQQGTAKQLATAAQLAAKGTVQASNCKGGGGGTCDATHTLTVMIDGTDIAFDTFGYFRSTDAQSLVIGGTISSPFSSLSLVFQGVTKADTYTVDPFSSWIDHGNVDFRPPASYTTTGTVTLTKFAFTSETSGCTAGTIDVTFSNPGAGRTVHVTGSFALSQPGM